MTTTCYHGGAFFNAIGPEFDRLERRHTVIAVKDAPTNRRMGRILAAVNNRLSARTKPVSSLQPA